MRNNTILFLLTALIFSCSRSGQTREETAENVQVNRDTLAVEVLLMEPGPFTRRFEVTGETEALQDVFISPEINGQVKRVNVERGQRVDRDALLVRLNTDLTEKNIAEVRTSLELATRLFEKQEDLWEQKIGSEIQYLEAKNNKESLEARLATLEQQMDQAVIRAPFPGIVEEILVKEGELASPGMQLLRLVNLGTMRVSARISEAYLNSVREGDVVELHFPAYPGEVITEKITRVGEVIDPLTRTFVLEVVLENRGEKLKPNMLTSVMVTDFRKENALVVPSIVLRQDFSGTFLFLARDQRAEKVYVETGLTVQDETMIREGVEPGDRVIIRGFNLAADGVPLRIANQ